MKTHIGPILVSRQITDGNTGILLGAGTDTSPQATTSTAAFVDFRTQGPSRSVYVQHYLAGTAGSALAAVTRADTAAATGVQGVLSRLTFGSAGDLDTAGSGSAVRGEVHVPARVLGGNVSVLHSEVVAGGATSNVTAGSFLRCTLSGNATGVGLLDTTMGLLAVDGVTVGAAGSGHIIAAISMDKPVTHLAKILVNGTPYYIMLRNAV